MCVYVMVMYTKKIIKISRAIYTYGNIKKQYCSIIVQIRRALLQRSLDFVPYRSKMEQLTWGARVSVPRL